MPQHSVSHKLLSVVLIWLMACGVLLVPERAHAFLRGGFTIQDERELGEKFNVMIRSRLPLVQDTEIVGYVEGIVNRLAATMPPQPFPFTVSVIRHNAVNAFAAPGGYIFLNTGLLLAMENESEVAGVLAHEMAHVTQRHIANRIENSRKIGILSLVGMLAGVFLGGDAGGAAVVGSMAAGQSAMLSYSRSDEREADQVGMNYLIRAGYPPQGMIGAFEILNRRQWLVGSAVPTYLSTHPDIAERIRDMQVRVESLPAAQQAKRDDNRRFLRVQALTRARYSDPQGAAQAFSRQLNGPNRCIALMGLGILASRQNRINEAAGHFDQALACAPDDQLIVREAGRHHYTRGNKNQGVTLLRQAVAMSPCDVFALYYYARILGDLGKTAEAVEMARKVLLTVPEEAGVHELLARLYGEQRQMFLANLHMAYSGLYENNERKLRQFMDRARGLAASPAEQALLSRLDKLYQERKEFWK
jgi:predicted Zn-dependent protease